MASSRCYTRRIRRDSLNLPGSGKWTSTSPTPTCCAIGPARRTSTAKPTASTPECGSGRRSATSPATTGRHFLAPGYACVIRTDWLRRYHDTVLPKGATTTRCSLREPNLGTRETMGCGGLEKSTRAQPRIKYTWSAFWTTRGRLNSLFPRRATRLRREPYEALGTCKFTSPAPFFGGSNVT